MNTRSHEQAINQYRSASLDLATARLRRSQYESNYDRDLRALDVKHGEERVGIALDTLWKAQQRYKIDARTPV